MNGTVRQLIVVGVVLGLVCAGVVWWLERFELARIRGEIREGLAGEAGDYLAKWTLFQQWMREHGQPD